MSRQGRHGEWKFGELCQAQNAKADAVVNRAKDDQHGWDHILDIVPNPKPNLPADLQSHLLQCFVQIKTTNTKKATTHLKLSNAVKAAKSPFPCFVFLLQYKEDLENPIILGRHIWESEISHWLKRARETERSARKELNKQTVTMSFSEKDQLWVNPVDWIIERIKESGGDDYSVAKTGIVKTVGYENLSGEGTFTIGPLNSRDEVVLHELGLVEDLPVSEFRLFDLRFGIRSKLPIHEFEQGRLRLQRDGIPTVLQILSNTGKTFDIPALTWIPQTVPYDDPSFQVRVKAGQISLLISPNKRQQSLNIQFTSREPYPFLEQMGLICLLNWMRVHPVNFCLTCDSGELFQGEIKTAEIAEPWMSDFEAVGSHFIHLLGREKCADVSVSLRDFHDVAKQLRHIPSLFSAENFQLSAEHDDPIAEFEKLIGYYLGQFGPWAFSVIFEAKLLEKTTDGRHHKFLFSKLKAIRQFSFKQSIERARQQTLVDFAKIQENQTSEIAILSDGDLIAFLKAMATDGTLNMQVV
jgi:hypothetical protein